MRPSEALARNIDEVRSTIAAFPVRNPRVFGSAALGKDKETSDLDILVDALDSADYYDIAGLEMALEKILGVRVEVATTGELREAISETVLRQARPI